MSNKCKVANYEFFYEEATSYKEYLRKTVVRRENNTGP